MPKFVTECDLPGAGALPDAALRIISRKSGAVLDRLGPPVQWLHSYVTDDRLYCVYIAPDEAAVRQHALRSGFPADRIARVCALIDPTTAERAQTAAMDTAARDFSPDALRARR